MWTLSRLARNAGAGLCAVAALVVGMPGFGQTVTVTGSGDEVIDVRVTNIVVPQAAHGHAINWAPQRPGIAPRPPIPAPSRPIEVTSIAGDIQITDGVATTTMRMTLHNPGTGQQEAVMMVPVPNGASIRQFGFDGAGLEPTAKIVPRDEARRIYESIVNRSRDPALLEFVGFGLVRSSVFPVAAGASQNVSLTYEQVLPRDGERMDFVLPRTASLEGSATKWTLSGRIKSEKAIATVYSPSHELRTTRVSEKELRFELPEAAATQPGALRISALMEKGGADGGLATSILAYPDAQGHGGYFLLLGGVAPVKETPGSESRGTQKRELVVVIDRSGSMRGEKIEQARAAALQVVEGLKEGEAFNIIDFSSTVERFSPKPVIKDGKTTADARKYISDIKADGGTNIHDALMEALRPDATEGMLPMVLFLTDGMPTVGITNEGQIRDAAARANTHKRRMFTFGVGFDVNAPLLDHLADANRGASINVLPKEDVELAVSKVFKRLQGPVMNEPAMVVRVGNGAESTRAVRDVMPPVLPDLFEGDQLVVLGRYTTEEKIKLKIEGEYRGTKRSFDVEFDPASASSRNGFVGRLWASRRIGYLVDEIRQSAGSGTGPHEPAPELVKEIVDLSTRWGILTEYTSFLATEPGAPATAAVPMLQADDYARRTLSSRAASAPRDGAGSVNQSVNTKEAKAQSCANMENLYYDSNMVAQRVKTVQQAADQAMFCRGNRWVDGRILQQKQENAKPDKTIQFGSAEHLALACRLADEGGERNSLLAMQGEVMLLVDGQRVLVTAPEAEATTQTP